MKLRLNAVDGSLELDLNGNVVALGGAMPKRKEEAEVPGSQRRPPIEPPDAANDSEIEQKPKEIVGRPKNPPVTLFMAQGRQQLPPGQALHVMTLQLRPGMEPKLRRVGPNLSQNAVSWSELSLGAGDGLQRWLNAEGVAPQAGMSVVIFEDDFGGSIDLLSVHEKLKRHGFLLNEIELLYVPGSSVGGV